MHTALEQDANLAKDADMPTAVAHGVRAPLAALRASMEALAGGFTAQDPRSLAVRGALEEVVRLGQEMQTLLDYALPLPLQPMSCSLREIVCSAVEGVAVSKRGGVWVALENRGSRLQVDGPLLSRSLARLIESASAAVQGPILLRARVDAPDSVFSLVQVGPAPARTGEGVLKGTTATSVLALVLARRDVERMGGRFTFRRGDDGRIVSEIRFPGSPAQRAA